MDFFKNQARTYGFEEDAYLEAVKKVPIHPPDSFRWFLANGYKRQTA
jgi:hypothetical protein